MVFFPVVCVDDFFPKPDQIRDFALTADNLDWGPSEEGRWPGVRSKPLHEVNETLFREIATRYLLNHYDSGQIDNISYFVQIFFQKIGQDSAIRDKEIGEYNGGWVHCDYPYLHSSIIYLTPNASLSSGTSLYQPKDSARVASVVKTYSDFKTEFYKNEISCEDAEEYRIKNNDQFEKTAFFSNVYNRCIGFDGDVWHSADEFNKNEERLTLVIFWDRINGPMTNLQTAKYLPQGCN